VKKIKLAVAILFAASAMAALAVESFAYPPFMVKARKFGATDCTFCHVLPEGGAPWNARGQWLIKEKERRAADVVDVDWLAEYKPGKAEENKSEDKKPSEPAASAAKASPLEQELIGLHRGLIDAARRGDTSVAARLLADDLIITGPTGQILGKQQEIEGFSKIKLESFDTDEIKVHAYGDTAVMNYHLVMKGTFSGQDMSGDYRETLVWVKRNGGWQIVAAHVSQISK
jgi:ketosteroid isomerase-like protein